MDVSLKTLVESIARDLIDARYAADMAALELAERYRDHPHLRSLSIPSLNITNVQVDLRVVLEEPTAELTAEGRRRQEEAVRAASQNLAEAVIRTPSVVNTVRNASTRNALSRDLRRRLEAAMVSEEGAAPTLRANEIEAAINESLAGRRVELLPEDQMGRIRSDIAELGAKFTTEIRPEGPRVLLGTEALTKVDPASVSRISFTVDLSDKRWREIEDEDGGTRYVLGDE